MTTRWRLTFFWVMALALSLQGTSAAASHCSSDGRLLGSHDDVSTAMPTTEATAKAMTLSMTHPIRTDGAADAIRSASTEHGDKAPAHSGAAKCGACSPCCIAAAPPTSPLDVVRVDVSHAIAGTVAVPSSSFPTEGQDRPPRSILA